MAGFFAQLFDGQKGAKEFNRLSLSEKELVFYSEDKASFVHYDPIIDELVNQHKQKICYLTSAVDDPILLNKNPLIQSFYIGNATARTTLFLGLEAKVLIMTMPDLETFFIKKSKKHAVHYAYIFHSINSTSMVYRKGAFDHFDSIFCVGPHHLDEIKKTEEVYGLKEKKLVQHGYARLDKLIKLNKENPRTPNNDRTKVLIAPSWGEHGIIETIGMDLTNTLLKSGFQVYLRPHPMTVKQFPEKIDELNNSFKNNPNYKYDGDVGSTDSLFDSHIMISDWSGAAWEYALGLEKPVLYIDLPRKIHNPEYEKIGLTPKEIWIRNQVGDLVDVNNLNQVPTKINQLLQNPAQFKEKIESARNNTVFNLMNSGEVAAKALIEILKSL